MNFSDEVYVRIYTRDTITWKLLKWEGRTVLMHLMRKVDRSGTLELEAGIEGLAALLELPEDVTERGLESCVTRGSVVRDGARLLIPKFLEAQTALKSEAQRAREYRSRKQEPCADPHESSREQPQPAQTVTKSDESSRTPPPRVTKSDDRHESSLFALPCSTLLCSAVTPKSPWTPKGKTGHLAQAVEELFKRAPELKPRRTFASGKLGPMLATGLPQALETKLSHAWTELEQAKPPATWDDFLLLADWFLAGKMQWAPDPLPWIIGHLAECIERASAWRDDELRPKSTPVPAAAPTPAHEHYVPNARDLEARRLRKERADKEAAAQAAAEGTNAAAPTT